MGKIRLNETEIDYRIVRSSRTTIGLSVSAERGVIISIPMMMTDQAAAAVVEKKSGWILKHLHRIEQLNQCFEAPAVKPGLHMLYRGERYLLEVLRGEKKQPVITLTADRLLLTTNNIEPGLVNETLKKWYRSQADQIIRQRVADYLSGMNETVNRVCIKDQKTRWGSCSSKRNVNFNWRLVMAPPAALDYVVVHELCHLKHLNHSKDFWNYVGAVLPGYRAGSSWLRDHGQQLLKLSF